MGNDYKKKILSILVNWYENSPAYVRDQKPKNRRIMKLYDKGKTDFALYNIDDHIIRKDINLAVLDLADKKYIEFEWMQGEKNHIVSKLWLNFEAIDEVYKYLCRKPKSDTVEEVLAQLKALRDEIKDEWACRWLEETCAAISEKRSIGSNLPGDRPERDGLLKSILFLSKRTEIETLERVFSIQCFGDSKLFERSVKAFLVRIIKRYLVLDECTDDEALRFVGIVRYPEQFEFSGALSITMPGGMTDFAPLPSGGFLTIEELKQGQIKIKANIRRILSVENRTNYIDYIHKSQSKDELVLFHGGHFSPAKKVFLRAIVSSMPYSCMFCHWGDIDYGGFTMLARLRREIMPDIQAWRMGIDDLEQYSKYAASFSDAYRKRLASLLKVPELGDRFSCIEYMLKYGVRLEQEAMLAYQGD
jgi:hypothetical protein